MISSDCSGLFYLILIIRFSDFDGAKRAMEGLRDPKRFTGDGLAGAHTRPKAGFEGFHQVTLEFSGEVGGQPGWIRGE
jgi:hypothetical protein